jgi:hypothetical protein
MKSFFSGVCLLALLCAGGLRAGPCQVDAISGQLHCLPGLAGVGPANKTNGIVAGPNTTQTITLTPPLVSISPAELQCWTGTGTGPFTAVPFTYTTTGSPITSVTFTYTGGSTANVTCAVNSSGVAGPAGANGTNGTNGATGSTGPQGPPGIAGAVTKTITTSGTPPTATLNHGLGLVSPFDQFVAMCLTAGAYTPVSITTVDGNNALVTTGSALTLDCTVFGGVSSAIAHGTVTTSGTPPTATFTHTFGLTTPFDQFILQAWQGGALTPVSVVAATANTVTITSSVAGSFDITAVAGGTGGGIGGGGTWGSITGTLSSQTDLQTALNGKQATLGFTPENVANKGAANGYAPLVSSLVPLGNLGGITPAQMASLQGNGAKFQLSTGATTTNDCVKFDVNGNTVDAGSACGSGSGFANPMTTAGDIIIGTTGGTAARLAIGSAGQVLTVTSGAPAWGTGGSGASTVAQLTDFGITGMGTSTLTLGATCVTSTPCNVSNGSVVSPFNAGSASLVNVGTSAIARIGIDFSVSPPTLRVINNAGSVTCTGMSCSQNTGSQFETTTKPLWQCTATGSTWDASGCTDLRALNSFQRVTGTAGVICTPNTSTGTNNCSADSTTVPLHAMQTETFSATPVFNYALGDIISMTLTANVTSSTFINSIAAQDVHFHLCQDATGSRTFIFPTTFHGQTTIGTTASKCNDQTFWWDGSAAWAKAPGVTNQ